MQQEQSTDNVIDELMTECKIYRFASELQTTTDENRKTSLRQILNVLQRCDKAVIEGKEDSTQKKLDMMFEQETQYALKKSWAKLNDNQRINRIKFYISQLIMDDNKKKDYEKKVLELYETKKLKKAQVLYNEKTGEISKIDVEI